MNMGSHEWQSFAKAELMTFAFGEIEINQDLCLETLKKNILEEFNNLNLPDTKKGRPNYFKIKGAVEESYSEKVLNLDKERQVIYGIRHFGGDPETPFIQLRANFEMASKEKALLIYEEIQPELELFKPLYLVFMGPHKVKSDFFGNITMVSKAHHIKKRTPWDSES